MAAYSCYCLCDLVTFIVNPLYLQISNNVQVNKKKISKSTQEKRQGVLRLDQKDKSEKSIS